MGGEWLCKFAAFGLLCEAIHEQRADANEEICHERQQTQLWAQRHQYISRLEAHTLENAHTERDITFESSKKEYHTEGKECV